MNKGILLQRWKLQELEEMCYNEVEGIPVRKEELKR